MSSMAKYFNFSWANDVFGYSNLYGPDRNQYLRVIDTQSEANPGYLVLYVNIRPNKRIYIAIDKLATNITSASSIYAMLNYVALRS